MDMCPGNEVAVHPVWIPTHTSDPPHSGGNPHLRKAPVSTLAPRHRAPHPTSTATLSRSTWRRVRQTLTVGVFVVTTAVGVTIGLNGAARLRPPRRW
jgi:hypothetical protein